MIVVKGEDLSKIKQGTSVVVDLNENYTTVAVFHSYDAEEDCAVVIDTFVKIGEDYNPSFANYGAVLVPDFDDILKKEK